jgi:hypothetical protein
MTTHNSQKPRYSSPLCIPLGIYDSALGAPGSKCHNGTTASQAGANICANGTVAIDIGHDNVACHTGTHATGQVGNGCRDGTVPS